jgi:CspA family cold shock protein
MAAGIVKWFDEKKGYGFITAPDGGADIFVHYSGIQGEGFKTLAEGEQVTYNLVVGEKGPKAENVIRTVTPAGTNAQAAPAAVQVASAADVPAAEAGAAALP